MKRYCLLLLLFLSINRQTLFAMDQPQSLSVAVQEQQQRRTFAEFALSGERVEAESAFEAEMGKRVDLSKKGLTNLDGIHELDLYDQNDTVIPRNELDIVIVDDNYLREISPDLIGLGLIALHAKNNQLTSIPDTIGQIQYFNKLKVSGNTIRCFPTTLQNLDTFTELTADDNQMRLFPSGVVQCIHLEKLKLHNNKIRELPGEIGRLQNLRFLNLRANKLRSLPQQFINLTALQTLDLSKNQLSTLPNNLQGLTNLQCLYLDDNPLRIFGPQICQLRALKELDLSNCMLIILPPQICLLSRLESLYLANNRLKKLPLEIGNLKKLVLLDLTNNRLKTLPAGLGYCTQLDALSIMSNNFDSVETQNSSAALVRSLVGKNKRLLFNVLKRLLHRDALFYGDPFNSKYLVFPQDIIHIFFKNRRLGYVPVDPTSESSLDKLVVQ